MDNFNKPECDNCNELIAENIELQEQIENLQDIVKVLGKELRAETIRS